MFQILATLLISPGLQTEDIDLTCDRGTETKLSRQKRETHRHKNVTDTEREYIQGRVAKSVRRAEDTREEQKKEGKDDPQMSTNKTFNLG